MKIKIRHRFGGSILFKADAKSLGAAVVAAISAKADLRYADLTGADLTGAVLTRANSV